MGQAGKYLRRVGAADGYTAAGYAHWCPACGEMHAFATDGPNSNGARWTFDGNLEAPTFQPSMNIKTGRYADPDWVDDGDDRGTVCHYRLIGGKISYLSDCTHELKGQTVSMIALPDHLTDK